MKDMKIKEAVIDELEWEPSVDAAHIGVAVEGGVVALTGHVPSFTEKLAAERAARRVKGVKAVALEIDVRLPTILVVDDEDIARRAAATLQWHASIPDGAVKATVDKGHVTLHGELDWQYQRRAAENAMRALQGVVGVTNRVTLRTRTQPADLKRRIESALARNAAAEAKGIEVKVTGGEVTLTGEVESWHERKLVEDAVWAAPGVSSVQDQIHIR